MAAPAADQLVHALRRRAGHRPRHPDHGAVQPAGPVRGVEGAAAHRRLDHDGAPGQGGDQAVAGQEAQPGGRRSPGGASETTAPSAARWSSSGAVGRRVGPVDPAGEHRDACARRPRARRGGRPGRCRTPRPRPRSSPPRPMAAAMSAAASAPYVVAERDPTTATDRSSESSRSGPLTHSPSGGPPRSCTGVGRAEVVEPRGPLGVAGHDEADAEPLGPVEVALGVGRGQPRGEVVGSICRRRPLGARVDARTGARSRPPARPAGGLPAR